jgi:predicted transporter
MTRGARLRYTLYIAIVLFAAVSLVLILASADSIRLLPPSAFDLALSPTLFGIAYVLAFLVSPVVARRFRVKRDWQ